MIELPPPEWLIDGVMPKQALGMLFGPSGHGKSFLALDMALSVATGREWFSHRSAQGQVIYVVAEGGRGMVKRVKAWLHHRNVPQADQAFFILEAPQLLERAT